MNPVEKSEVSIHLARVWTQLRGESMWLTSKEIAQRAEVMPRTARAHATYLVGLGLVDQMETHPGHLYRISPNAEKRNTTAWERLETVSKLLLDKARGSHASDE